MPKSTARHEPGQFWAVPLSDGRFACGRVLQVRCGRLLESGPRVAFFGGLLDWVGRELPTFESIAGAGLLRCGDMHILAILHTGGQILGERALELDNIEIPTLISAQFWRNATILSGVIPIRSAVQRTIAFIQPSPPGHR